MDSSVCNVFGALANAEYQIMQELNAKFVSLERLAALLYELSSLGIKLPDISGLVSLSAITPAVYAQLNISCPQLGLPPPSAGLDSMIAQVAASYKIILGQYQLHPWNRLAKLQRQMADLMAEVNAGAALGYDVLNCLQSACLQIASGNVIAIQVSGATVADVVATASLYQTNFITKGGNVLTPAMQASVGQVTAGISSINNLFDVSYSTVPVNTSLPPVNYSAYTH